MGMTHSTEQLHSVAFYVEAISCSGLIFLLAALIGACMLLWRLHRKQHHNQLLMQGVAAMQHVSLISK